jgi:hypothetical protein
MVMSCYVQYDVYELGDLSVYYKRKQMVHTWSMDELGTNGIPVLPNVGFIVSHVQIPQKPERF